MSDPLALTRFHHNDAGMEAHLAEFLATRAQQSAGDVQRSVSEILQAVRMRGDDAVCEYTNQYDRLELTPDRLALSKEEIDSIAADCPADVVNALELAAARIKTYHAKQLPADWNYTDEYGSTLGMRWSAVDAAGIYVPGGTASYPSSVLMNALPARAAGVERIAMVVPTPDDIVNPAIIAAANIAGVSEIYRIGGAQAIGALAYGTASIPPVHVIVGPGNAYVAEAKRQVFGKVGIDMVAGPSEILVVADGSVDPAWIAADLLSQAEHDTLAQSILITTDAAYGDIVAEKISKQLAELPRRQIAEDALNHYGAIITARDMEHACALANMIAGEHAELAVVEPEIWATRITHAGALFYGAYTPEAMGDYIAGPSHVLPTTGTAAFSSGLSVYDFMKKTSLIDCSREGFNALAEAAATLADCEGLQAHAHSIRIRKP